jgi:NADH-ubiquinone oxidoreductase chain 5
VIFDVCWIFEYKLGTFVGAVIDFGIVVDWVSSFFMCVVLLISFCVFMYRVDYMGGELFLSRFCFLVVLFIISMGVVIFSSNLIGILLGWDGLGLVSYALVIYYQNARSLNAGVITVLSNRVGDIGLLMGIVWMFGWGNWNYVFYSMVMEDRSVVLVGWFVMVGCITRRAQIPFSAWLPAAMAAPTPVSALVHSSTLVTAGVYLLIRFRVYYSFGWFSWILVFLSMVTTMIAGLCAIWEVDVRRIVALSTLRQLGFMMIILGYGCWLISYYHLLTHALFKSLLFLCVGYVIHGYMGEQDVRGVGGLIGSPVVSSAINISLLALLGFPFMSGYYSRDAIIESLVFGGLGYLNLFVIVVGLVMTVLYCLRLGYISVWGEGLYVVGVRVGGDRMMEVSIVILSFFSVIAGRLMCWWLFRVPFFVYVDRYVRFLGLMAVLFGVLCLLVIMWDLWWLMALRLVDYFGGGLWFFSNLSGNCLVILVDASYADDDFGWGEVVGGWGFGRIVVFFSKTVELMWDNLFMVIVISVVGWVVVFFFCCCSLKKSVALKMLRWVVRQCS